MARTSHKPSSGSPLQSEYRRAMSASVVAHARYLATKGEKNVTQHRIEKQKTTWDAMEARKAKIRERLMLGNNAN